MNKTFQKTVAGRLRALQSLLQFHSRSRAKSDCGENTIYVSPGKIDMTDLNGTIVARGPCKVATVLLRRCRKTGKIKR